MVPDKSIFNKFKSLSNRVFMNIKKQIYLVSGRKPRSVGYDEYKLECICKSLRDDVLLQFRRNELPKGYGYGLDERVVEYPWLVSRIKDSEQIVLDAGSALNFPEILTSMQLREKKLYIDTLYCEGRPVVMPSPSYVYEDLRDICFRDDFFDAIYSLSTVEHIGMDNTMMYTPDTSYREQSKFSYLMAIQEFRRVLKPGGTLYVSVPYGRYRNHGWFQVFDADMVEQLIHGFSPCSIERTYYNYSDDQWNVSTEEKCADGDYYDPHIGDEMPVDTLAAARCVVCIELMKSR